MVEDFREGRTMQRGGGEEGGDERGGFGREGSFGGEGVGVLLDFAVCVCVCVCVLWSRVE